MKIHASGEDYLEAILILQKQMGEGTVRSVTLPGIWNSVSRASAMR